MKFYLKYIYYLAIFTLVLYLFFWSDLPLPIWLYDRPWLICLFLFLIIFTGYIIGIMVLFVKSTYGNSTITPAPEVILNPKILALSDEFISNGFISYGPPLKSNHFADFEIVPFIDQERLIVGSICHIKSNTDIYTIGFDSKINNDTGGLGTTTDISGSLINIRLNELRQIFPDTNLDTLLTWHRNAIRFLEETGFKFDRMSNKDFIEKYESEKKELEQYIRKHFIKITFVFLWRKLSGKTPFLGPIMNQTFAKKQIQHLLKKCGMS